MKFRTGLYAAEKPPGDTLLRLEHPWRSGYIFYSPGAHFSYRVVGPCCRLFDREQLPWPCCRIQWRSKEPSWRRIGKRFTADMATKNHPSYCVELLGGHHRDAFVLTLYLVKLSQSTKEWWYSNKLADIPAENEL